MEAPSVLQGSWMALQPCCLQERLFSRDQSSGQQTGVRQSAMGCFCAELLDVGLDLLDHLRTERLIFHTINSVSYNNIKHLGCWIVLNYCEL